MTSTTVTAAADQYELDGDFLDAFPDKPAAAAKETKPLGYEKERAMLDMIPEGKIARLRLRNVEYKSFQSHMRAAGRIQNRTVTCKRGADYPDGGKSALVTWVTTPPKA